MVLLTLALNDRLRVCGHNTNTTLRPRKKKIALCRFCTPQSIQSNSHPPPHLQGTNVKAVAVSPGAVASDIWRSWPKWYRSLVLDPAMALLFLDNDQGSTPSVYAATHPLEGDHGGDGDGGDSSPFALAPYYQPYWTPGPAFLFPFEACGPFNGWRRVRPRLPPDALRVAKELWFTSERCLQQHGHA